MKTILSIDWDFFVNATVQERFNLFPDGGNENLPQSVSSVVWAVRYANSKLSADVEIGRDISTMGILEHEFNLIEDFLRNSNVLVYAAESHSKAYEVLLDRLEGDEACKIVNIDFHHDLYKNIPDEVDCGNWLRELRKRVDIENITWVAREDSEEVPEDCKEFVVKTTELEKVLAEMDEPDCVFICRSGVWSPPHLDDRFNELLVASQIYGLPNGRYTENFKESVKFNCDQMEVFKRK